MENYMNPYFIFKDIAIESSKKGKEAIIKEHAKNKGFLEILNFVYNPMITTGISKKKLNKDLTNSCVQRPSKEFTTIFDIMHYLKVNNTGRDEDIFLVQEFIESLKTEDIKEFASAVVTKDLKIGITMKTINKALGYELISEFKTMKASRYEGQPIKGEFALSIKLDGTHCEVFNLETGAEFYTQEGRRIHGLVELEEQFKLLPKDRVYSGELLAVNKENLHSKDLFLLTQEILKTDGIKKDVTFNIFDNLEVEEFKKGFSPKSFKERMAEMDYIMYFLLGDKQPNLIKQVPIVFIGEEKDVNIERVLDVVLDQGYEGLMINTMDGIYEAKRSKDLYKVKKFYYFDLEVVDVEEHKHGNKLGAFVVDYKGYRVNVGSGFSDDERIEFWNNKEEMIGRVIEVKNFGESKNKKGGLSLRFPTFKTLREEGKEVSYH